MKHFSALLCLFIFAVGDSVAQVNLVPNGGFNEFDACPTGALGINACSHWFNPNSNCTPDYYHVCANGSNNHLGIPDNSCSYYSFEGDGMVRISLYAGGGEPIEVELIDTLQAGGIYRFSVKLKRDCSYGACGSIGVLFTDTIFQPTGYCDNIQAIPQLQRDRFDLMTSFEWYTYVDTLYAEGHERYMTITNFLHDSLFILQNGPIPNAALYWIDDVSLIHTGYVDVPDTQPEVSLHVTSQIVAQHLEITSNKALQLDLMDISGRLIFSKRLNAGLSSIDIASIPNGMYVVIFTTENHQLASRRILKVN